MTLMCVDDPGATWVPASGGRYLLAGRNEKQQCGQKDFKVKQNVLAGYPALVTGAEGSAMYDCSPSQKFAQEVTKLREVLSKTFRILKIRISRNSLFFGHRYMQHAGMEWSSKHFPHYHIYLIPECQVRGDAINFAYGESLEARVQVWDDDGNLVLSSRSIPAKICSIIAIFAVNVC